MHGSRGVPARAPRVSQLIQLFARGFREGMAAFGSGNEFEDARRPGAPPPLQLFEGGPLWRLLVSTRLVDPPRKLLLRRIVALLAFTWLPLVLLSAGTGTAIGNRVELPLIRDLAVHVRFLLAVPLLVLGEVLLHAAVGAVLRYLAMSGIVPPEEEPKLAAILARGRRRRDSLGVELLLVAIAFGGAALAFSSVHELFHGLSSWRMQPESDGSAVLTRAGWWHSAISVPLFQFLVLRWLWRLVIWRRRDTARAARSRARRSLPTCRRNWLRGRPDRLPEFLFAIKPSSRVDAKSGGTEADAQRGARHIIGARTQPVLGHPGSSSRRAGTYKRLGRLSTGVGEHHGRLEERCPRAPPESSSRRRHLEPR